MDGRTDGRMDGRNDDQKSPCVLQDFVPFRATALLPLTLFHNYAKQGNGYRWPHIALGRPVLRLSPNTILSHIPLKVNFFATLLLPGIVVVRLIPPNIKY